VLGGVSSSHEDDKINEEYKIVFAEFSAENLQQSLSVQPDGEMAASINAFIDLVNGHQCSQVISTISSEFGKAAVHDSKAKVAIESLIAIILKDGDSNYLHPLHVKSICDSLAVVCCKNDTPSMMMWRMMSRPGRY
jgi:hypothetical protein